MTITYDLVTALEREGFRRVERLAADALTGGDSTGTIARASVLLSLLPQRHHAAATMHQLLAGPFNVSVADLVLCYPCSVRLANCMKREENTHAKRLGWMSVLFSPEEAKQTLLAIENLGLKSYHETTEIVQAFARAVTRVAAGTTKDRDASVAPPQSAHTPALDTPVRVENSLKRSLTDILSALSEREQAVIRSRIGLSGPKATLDELGRKLGVTRERVRQIESKALGALRRKELISALRANVAAELPPLLNEILHPYPFGPYSETLQAICEKSPNARLLDRVSPPVFRSLLQVSKIQKREVVVAPSTGTSDLHSKAHAVIAVTKAADKAIPLSTLAGRSGTDVHFTEATILVMKTATVYMRWLINGSSVRKRRFVHLAHILTEGQGRALPAYDLWQRYRKRFQSDNCSGRDLQIVMQDYPHHFVNLHHLGWKYIGPDFESAPAVTSDSLPTVTSQLLSSSEPKTLGPRVYSFLLHRGPAQFYSARAAFCKLYPEYSEVSFGVTLVMNPEFLRLAPGIYGVPEHLRDGPSFRSRMQVILRDTSHIDAFLLTRLAGDPHITYPAWVAEQQYAWADYLLAKEDNQRLSALLDVADIDSWPVGATAKAVWLKRRAQSGRRWAPSEPNLKDRTVSPYDFYTLLEASEEHGNLNMPFGNAALGWRIDTGRIWILLAILTAARMILPTGSWLSTHIVTPAGEAFMRQCRSEAGNGDTLRAIMIEELLSRVHPIHWVTSHFLAIAKEACQWADRTFSNAPSLEPEELSTEEILQRSREFSIRKIIDDQQ